MSWSWTAEKGPLSRGRGSPALRQIAVRVEQAVLT